MTTTAETLIQETRRHVFSGSREQVNTLAVGIGSSVNSLTTNYALRQITEGSLIEIDLELMLVLAADTTSNLLTVLRAQFGTAAGSHLDDAVITVNPKFSRFAIFQAINEELAALSAEGLFQMVEDDLTYNPSIMGYDLASSVLDIYSVRYSLPGPEKSWPEITKYDLARNMPSSDFSTGNALILYEGGYSGRTVRVAYKAPFTQLSGVTDVVTTVSGLNVEALDILPLGAAARLVAPRDVKRAFTENQGDTRRSDEVPAGASMASARGLLAMRDRRVQQEIARLKRYFPPRLSVG